MTADESLPPPAGADQVTVDTLLRGRATLLQPVRGFRSSLDPVLLATFVKPPFGRYIDIGCGTGALAFLLAAADAQAWGIGVEIQARLAALARAGLARNTFAARVRILHDDVRRATGRSPLAGASFDLVATNPPYRAVSSGLPSPDPERAQANHEISLTMNEWLDAAATLMKPDGRVAAVYPAERLPDLLSGLWLRGFNAVRVRLVQPRADRPASRALVEARLVASEPDGRQQQVLHEPPLVLHEQDGTYTREMRVLLREESPSDSDPE